MSTEPNPTSTPADVTVTFTATVEPTAHDRTRYHAGSVWTVPAERAAQLIADGLAVETPATPGSPEPAAAEEE